MRKRYIRQTFLMAILIITTSCLGSKTQISNFVKDTESNINSSVQSEKEVLIWESKAGNHRLRWTTSDVYFGLFGQNERASLQPTITRTNKLSVEQVKQFWLANPMSRRGEVVSIGSIRLLSVVGSIVSFEISRGGWVEGYIPSNSELYWETIDLDKPMGSLIFIDADNNYIGFASVEIDLSDLYSVSEIVAAIYENPIVKTNMRGKSQNEAIQLLTEVFDKGLQINIEDESYRINTTGFAFNRIQGDNVVIKIQISPTANDSGLINHLEIKLPILSKMKGNLIGASAKKSGFLNSDLEKISGGRESKVLISTKVE